MGRHNKGEVHPVAAIHRGRGGSRPSGVNARRVTFHDRDVDLVLRPGWLPEPDDLPSDSHGEPTGGQPIKFIQMDQLRQEQSRHIEQVAEAQAKVRELKRRFEQEDAAHADALKSAFATGAERPEDKRTPNGKREASLKRAKDSAVAAEAAAIAWGEDALQRARGLTQSWESAVEEVNGRLRNEIEDLERRIEKLRTAKRANDRLATWIKRLTNPIGGNIMPFRMISRTTPWVSKARSTITVAAPPDLDEDTEQGAEGAA